MRKDRITAQQQQLESTKTAQASGGWLGWMWGGNQNTDVQEDAENIEGVLSEEERKQLYDALNGTRAMQIPPISIFHVMRYL